MNKIILDTDILIDFLRGNPHARDFILEMNRDYVCCCSVIAIAEIYAGMREKEKTATDELLDGFYHFPVTRAIAERAGHLKQESKSNILALDDCLIAATAEIENSILATRNRKHYPFRSLTLKIPNY
jgi:predicted nucleic acid-binding protein